MSCLVLGLSGNDPRLQFQKSRNVSTANVEVRLQWDPDHTPEYTKCARRAIQLGLKGQVNKLPTVVHILTL